MREWSIFALFCGIIRNCHKTLIRSNSWRKRGEEIVVGVNGEERTIRYAD